MIIIAVLFLGFGCELKFWVAQTGKFSFCEDQASPHNLDTHLPPLNLLVPYCCDVRGVLGES